ncbi:MAG: sulfotransferase family protein [Caulobacteraceae bacterium]|nr:sulfotransferase family protein [Caulobacteraceae bacterium]
MIVSHRRRLIFLKTQKTGGTSVELALSQLCGPEDIITPLTDEDETLRGEVTPRNYAIPLDRRPPWWRLLEMAGKRGPRAGTEFHEHMNAQAVRRALGAEIFDSYLKVTIVRNAWDREVSRYFWATRGDAPRRPFDRWVRRESSNPERKTWKIYTLDDQPVADVVMRHETLAKDFDALLERLGCAGAVRLPRAKGAHRTRGRDYREFYTPETRALVARRYHREIAYFGMTFDGAAR